MEKCELHREIETSIGEIKASLKKIETALLGDFETMGLVTKLYELEKRLSEIEKLKTEIEQGARKMVGKAIWYVVSGFLGGILTLKGISLLISLLHKAASAGG